MEKISDKAIREEKIERLKEKILSEIKYELDNIKTELLSCNKMEDNFFEYCITKSYRLLALKEYVERSGAFNTTFQYTPDDPESYVVPDKYIDIWLQDDYNFTNQFMQHASSRKYKYELYNILTDEFLGLFFTNDVDNG